MIRINTRDHDEGSKTENDQKSDGVQDPNAEIFNGKNVSYGLKEPLHYFTVVAVPPAFSIALTAVSEKA